MIVGVFFQTACSWENFIDIKEAGILLSESEKLEKGPAHETYHFNHVGGCLRLDFLLKPSSTSPLYVYEQQRL